MPTGTETPHTPSALTGAPSLRQAKGWIHHQGISGGTHINKEKRKGIVPCCNAAWHYASGAAPRRALKGGSGVPGDVGDAGCRSDCAACCPGPEGRDNFGMVGGILLRGAVVSADVAVALTSGGSPPRHSAVSLAAAMATESVGFPCGDGSASTAAAVRSTAVVAVSTGRGGVCVGSTCEGRASAGDAAAATDCGGDGSPGARAASGSPSARATAEKGGRFPVASAAAAPPPAAPPRCVVMISRGVRDVRCAMIGVDDGAGDGAGGWGGGDVSAAMVAEGRMASGDRKMPGPPFVSEAGAAVAIAATEAASACWRSSGGGGGGEGVTRRSRKGDQMGPRSAEAVAGRAAGAGGGGGSGAVGGGWGAPATSSWPGSAWLTMRFVTACHGHATRISHRHQKPLLDGRAPERPLSAWVGGRIHVQARENT